MAFDGTVLRPLDLEVLTDETAAEGVVRIAVARMVSAIKQVSVAKGHDPRDFTLVAYGGAGPMHGAFIAEELEIERVLVPTEWRFRVLDSGDLLMERGEA